MDNIHAHRVIRYPLLQSYNCHPMKSYPMEDVSSTLECVRLPEIDVFSDGSQFSSPEFPCGSSINRVEINNRIYYRMPLSSAEPNFNSVLPEIYSNGDNDSILDTLNGFGTYTDHNKNNAETELAFVSLKTALVSNNNVSEENNETEEIAKPTKTSRPNSSAGYLNIPAGYAKYVFDPPKTPKVCPSTKRKAAEPESQSEVTESSSSRIFVTLQSGQMYAVQFTTSNVTLSPLYVDKRCVAGSENDKKIQPSHTESTDAVQNPEAFSHIMRSKYEICEEKSRQKQPKAILPPLRVYTGTIPKQRKRANSEPARKIKIGFINLTYKDMVLRIRVPVFPIGRIKPPVSEDIIEQMNRLGMPTSDSRKNKATIVVRCGSDLLQFRFDMNDISMDYVEVKGSTAVQTEDKMVYIRERSIITGRTMLLALPESTYFYQDPLATIRRLHGQLQHSHVVPLWKYELMKARIADRQGSTQFEEKLDKIYQQTRGSRFFFEGLDALISAQTGLLCAEVVNGQSAYEDLMLEYQGQKPQRKRMPQFWRKKQGQSSEAISAPKTDDVENQEPASVEVEEVEEK